MPLGRGSDIIRGMNILRIMAIALAALAVRPGTAGELKDGDGHAAAHEKGGIDVPVKRNDSHSENMIWDDAPAKDWNGFYPVGNGWMGAMVDAGAKTRLQLNEYQVWKGRPHRYDVEGAADYLPKIRELILAGNNREATKLCDEKFFGQPNQQCAYQPAGWLELDFGGEAVNLVRALDFAKAAAESAFEVGGIKIVQETFAPYQEKDAIVHRARSEGGAMRATITFRAAHGKNSSICRFVDSSIEGRNRSAIFAYDAEVEKDGVKYAGRAKITVKGPRAQLGVKKDQLKVTGAEEIEIRLTIATNVKSWKELGADEKALADAQLERISEGDFDSVRARHREEFAKLYDQVELHLDSAAYPECAPRPGDESMNRRIDESTNRRIDEFSNSNPRSPRRVPEDARPEIRRTRLQLRPLSPHLLVASGRPARNAAGTVEPGCRSELALALYREH